MVFSVLQSIANFKGQVKGCVHPCKKIENGKMMLDKCVAVNATQVCTDVGHPLFDIYLWLYFVAVLSGQLPCCWQFTKPRPPLLLLLSMSIRCCQAFHTIADLSSKFFVMFEYFWQKQAS